MSIYTTLESFRFGKYMLQAYMREYNHDNAPTYGVSLTDTDTKLDLFDLEFDTEAEALDHFDMDKQALEVSA